MRKIEKQMIEAVMQSKDWRSGNTEVVVSRNKHGTPVHADVLLFKNHIARWFYGYSGRPVEVAFTPVVCSNTTKGRLNALLGQLGAVNDRTAPGIYQRNFDWFMDAGSVKCHVSVSDVWRVWWSVQADMWRAEATHPPRWEQPPELFTNLTQRLN